MPAENLQLHQQSVTAFNTRDPEAFVAFCDPQIELHSAVTVPGGAVYHGHHGVRKWHRDLADVFGTDLWIEAEAYYDLGDQTISFHVLRGRGHQSGADVAMPAAHHCKWRDGLIVFFRGYSERDNVWRELGVSADAVERLSP